MLLHNITTKLKPGGYFVGTIPDANYIVYVGEKEDVHDGRKEEGEEERKRSGGRGIEGKGKSE
jgi:mRNA capping enzyme